MRLQLMFFRRVQQYEKKKKTNILQTLSRCHIGISAIAGHCGAKSETDTG